MTDTTRLSRLEAARVVARRDFHAILFSRAFLFFLLGPLFPIVIGALAGGIGGQVQRDANTRLVAVAMSEADTAAMRDAQARLAPQIGSALPELAATDSSASPETILREPGRNYVAVVSGSLGRPEITAPAAAIERWRGPIAILVAEASASDNRSYPEITANPVATSIAAQRSDRIRTAQAGQLLLFLLMMLLAGMVLSNLVEEKANKVIEVLAAAIPMDAVFLGKLAAMLGVSLVGIAVWGAVGSAIALLAGNALPQLPEPALGWPLFATLGLLYFAMGYLLLGSLFLTIGGMAATVREVQTLSMPVTMAQLLVFFLAASSITRPGSPLELFAAIFPLSSPFAMLARAAQSDALWPHALALGWQALCVLVFVRVGATIFRRRVMKSGKGGRAIKGHVGGTTPA
ncbi:ABC transporter permease [Qipengyuania flava]|uniref:ABC transporter permease n=1 Tax=Qipengyuania flava TaxID=192812 RepID=UPI001C5A0AA8|nr:ABC transporter permease [Qipengyuania flava]MBW3167047.1 ABC transporter permease [Qipengyuania flava]MBY5964285.1 ABC transporter permease [Qipengyuania flava]MBY6010609.1 ABC transporter permease [Qipengyuania flava]MBY6025051.1 ABC transporter permease [Qipengyuania flava]